MNNKYISHSKKNLLFDIIFAKKIHTFQSLNEMVARLCKIFFKTQSIPTKLDIHTDAGRV